MRMRSLACLFLLLIAVALLTGCDQSGGRQPTEAPASTDVPTLPPKETADPNEGAGAQADPFDIFAIRATTEPEQADTKQADTSVTQDIFSSQNGTLANDVEPTQNADEPAEPETTPEPVEESNSDSASSIRITPDPQETPIGPLDPWDKPTPVPLNIAYVEYKSDPMGVSFERPAGWSQEAPADSNVLFTEPAAAARDGYRTMLTVRAIHKGSKQTKTDAESQLEELLEELAQNTLWTDFKANDLAPASMAGSDGYYTYYVAYFQGIKVRGRIMVVAKGNSLYMVRITSPAEHYVLYEDIYRKVRATWTFL